VSKRRWKETKEWKLQKNRGVCRWYQQVRKGVKQEMGGNQGVETTEGERRVCRWDQQVRKGVEQEMGEN
jgi:hypothetical protein